jgi:hypothetical protein
MTQQNSIDLDKGMLCCARESRLAHDGLFDWVGGPLDSLHIELVEMELAREEVTVVLPRRK